MIRGSVLIIDDEPLMRVSMVDALKAVGYEVQEASTGLEGLERLQASRFNLVITDLNMPNMDGIALIKAVRGMAAHKFTPILMLTTESSDDKKKEGQNAGATGWIVKPFNPEQMLATIKKVLPA